MSDSVFYGASLAPPPIRYDSSDRGMREMAETLLLALGKKGREEEVMVASSALATLGQKGARVEIVLCRGRRGEAVFLAQALEWISGEPARSKTLYRGPSITEALVRCLRFSGKFLDPDLLLHSMPEREDVCHSVFRQLQQV